MSTENEAAVGRPVRIVSLSFPVGRSREQVAELVAREGAQGADLIVLPETWLGQGSGQEAHPETLEGPTISAMAALAERYRTYVVCPLDRMDGARRVNSAVLLDRRGAVAGVYDKVFPWWGEYGVAPSVQVGLDAPVFACDFGRLGLAICFDVNFPEVWQRMADQDADLVAWSSAYSAGTTLQAHSLMYSFYIITSTQTCDCVAYDITGEELLYQHTEGLNVTRITLDLDRQIYHENYNLAGRDRLLAEHADEVCLEKWLRREQWFVLRATRAGVSARELARAYGMEPLREYIRRSRQGIDALRGWPFRERLGGT